LPPGPPGAGHWQAVKDLFDRLLALPAGERGAALQQAHVAAAVADEVWALLGQHDAEESQGGQFLHHALPPGDDGATGAAPAAVARGGQRLGAWVLDQPLGSGGMADVWSAHRADGAYEAQAAVKLLRPGVGNAGVLARFAGEQRALASLDHPHIARLLDAGRAGDGTPYFVMERVHGQAIDLACAGRPLAERLGLFLQLADAVALAHRHLLVHRDLKPANVLVTTAGQVKLLDFGIAKALDPLDDALGSADMSGGGLTQSGERPLTPHYASPEQVRGEPVATATDVYSLGVLLYGMLTGRRPYGRQAGSTREALHAVLHEAPLRPSAVADSPDPAWPALQRRLRGDLDRVVLKALAKDTAARYASVDAMAADVRAWLQGRPVSASTPRPGYLLRRFVARHRGAVAVASVALLALLGVLVALLYQVRETELARQAAQRRFEQVRQMAQRMVFDYHDRIVNLAGALPAREALLADTQRFLDGMAQELGGDTRLAQELAATYYRIAALQGETFSPSLERLDAAEANLDKALALQPLYVHAPGVDAQTLGAAADMWMARSFLHTRRARLQAGVQALERAHELAQRLHRMAGDTLPVLSRLATLQGRLGLIKGGSINQAQLGQLAAAGEHLQRSTALFETMVKLEPQSAEWQHQLAWALGNQLSWALLEGRNDEAVALGRRALALREAAAAGRPDDAHLRYQLVISRVQLGASLCWAGQFGPGRALLDDAYTATAALAQSDASNRAAHRDLAVLDVVRGRSAALAGDKAQALQRLDAALAALPDGPALAGDFFLTRWRVEALLWRARLRAPPQAALALQDAQTADTLLQATPADPANAARRWSLALVEGERAKALRQLGRAEEAGRAVQASARLWALGVPGSYRVWQERGG